jgi:hypothetical protein
MEVSLQGEPVAESLTGNVLASASIRPSEKEAVFVMAGHSRPKDGVASARLCPPSTSFLLVRSKDVDAGHKAGHDELHH